MKSNFLKFILLPLGTTLLVTFAGLFTQVVEYKPYGVPDSRRAEYEAKLEVLNERQKVRNGEIPAELIPVAKLDHSSHNFGMINPHTTTSHTFKITNEGQGPLTLKVQGTSCKCTVGELANDFLAAGESTTITMEWNTGYQADHYEQTAVVLTNDPINKELTLKVEGEVRAELIVPETVNLVAKELGNPATGNIVLYSQLWEDFTIVEVKSDDPELTIHWDVEPIEKDSAELADKFPKSAMRIRLNTPRSHYGKFSGNLDIIVRPDDGSNEVTRTVAYSGRVRPPISFISPEIHMTDGLDVGSLSAGKEYNFHVLVRARGVEGRRMDVLDVKPSELKATLKPLAIEGNYRLTLTVPDDCPMVIFNKDQDHGYVQVGDANDENFMNWFPLNGAVVKLQ